MVMKSVPTYLNGTCAAWATTLGSLKTLSLTLSQNHIATLSEHRKERPESLVNVVPTTSDGLPLTIDQLTLVTESVWQ